MSARTLTNFSPIGFDGDIGETIHIDGNGIWSETIDEEAEILDLEGAYLSPGWADIHVHIWHGGTDFSVRSSQAGLERGVTVLADAGSAGEASFHGLREYVIERADETIKAFINISTIGLIACNRVSEFSSMESIDVERTIQAIEVNRDVVCGVKVRCGRQISGELGIQPAKLARRVADICNLPLMVHIGAPPPVVDDVFELLRPGDIVTHCFHGKRGGSLLDTPETWDYARRLVDNGIVLDIGHGSGSFCQKTASTAVERGLKPTTISSDIYLGNIGGPVYDLATTASKLMHVGLSLEETISRITSAPRQAINLPLVRLGGMADFTVFRLRDQKIKIQDSEGQTMELQKIIEPEFAVIRKLLRKSEPSRINPE